MAPNPQNLGKTASPSTQRAKIGPDSFRAINREVLASTTEILLIEWPEFGEGDIGPDQEW